MNGVRGRAGFTLVEMLITLTVAGVLGAAILSLVLGQSRFYGQSDDTIYAQQSLRAAMDLMASELRMASPRDLMAAEQDSVRIRFDLRRGVVCQLQPSGNEAFVYIYDRVDNANLPSGFRGAAISGPYEAAWHYADNWTPSENEVAYGAAANTCKSYGAPDSEPQQRFHRIAGFSTAGFPEPPDRGHLLRFYGGLTYRFDASSFGEGVAVWRNNQELVSPFEEGASFSYVMEGGLVLPAVPDTDLLDVRAIRIEVAAKPDGANRYDVSRAISYDVPLRN